MTLPRFLIARFKPKANDFFEKGSKFKFGVKRTDASGALFRRIQGSIRTADYHIFLTTKRDFPHKNTC